MVDSISPPMSFSLLDLLARGTGVTSCVCSLQLSTFLKATQLEYLGVPL